MSFMFWPLENTFRKVRLTGCHIKRFLEDPLHHLALVLLEDQLVGFGGTELDEAGVVLVLLPVTDTLEKVLDEVETSFSDTSVPAQPHFGPWSILHLRDVLFCTYRINLAGSVSYTALIFMMLSLMSTLTCINTGHSRQPKKSSR